MIQVNIINIKKRVWDYINKKAKMKNGVEIYNAIRNILLLSNNFNLSIRY